MEASTEKAKYWQELIQDWRLSGQSKKEFAKSRGVSADVMSYWITKFKKAGQPMCKDSSFVPIVISEGAGTDQTITVHLSNGLSLAFGPDTPTTKICALASALSATYA
jgi:hypothetical protein